MGGPKAVYSQVAWFLREWGKHRIVLLQQIRDFLSRPENSTSNEAWELFRKLIKKKLRLEDDVTNKNALLKAIDDIIKNGMMAQTPASKASVNKLLTTFDVPTRSTTPNGEVYMTDMGKNGMVAAEQKRSKKRLDAIIHDLVNNPNVSKHVADYVSQQFNNLWARPQQSRDNREDRLTHFERKQAETVRNLLNNNNSLSQAERYELENIAQDLLTPSPYTTAHNTNPTTVQSGSDAQQFADKNKKQLMGANNAQDMKKRAVDINALPYNQQKQQQYPKGADQITDLDSFQKESNIVLTLSKDQLVEMLMKVG